MDTLSSLEIPHWLMIAGVVLLIFGFLGLMFRKNTETTEEETERPEPRVSLRSRNRQQPNDHGDADPPSDLSHTQIRPLNPKPRADR
jgi:hypothetical protein